MYNDQAVQKKKSVKIWIIMLILPIVLLFVVTIGQIVANFAFTSAVDSSSSDMCLNDGLQTSQTIDGLCEQEKVSGPGIIKTVTNLFSILLGTFSVIGILAYPVWITLLVVALQHNKKIDEAQNQQNTPQNQPPQTPVI